MQAARALISGAAQADDNEQRGETMLNYGYMGYQAERAKTQAEQREADVQLGQLCAALAESLRSLAKPVRALRRLSGIAPPAFKRAGQPAAEAICHSTLRQEIATPR
jgi:adenylosuccinate lyase